MEKYAGKMSAFWVGVHPRVSYHGSRPHKGSAVQQNWALSEASRPPAKSLVAGLFSYEREKWAKHRRLVNPTFQVEKLRVIIISIHLSCRKVPLSSGTFFEKPKII